MMWNFLELCAERMSQRLIISVLSQVAIMESGANQLMKSVVPYLDSWLGIPFALFAHE